ncbi:hypothetical protein NODU109028_09545 [Nocardioides dubius]|uniref:Uncharacterized protein n=1 Tax=Nocardioides dubius TaxID=317019 RepID=A0ABP4ER38_9ACTN
MDFRRKVEDIGRSWRKGRQAAYRDCLPQQSELLDSAIGGQAGFGAVEHRELVTRNETEPHEV